jgi:hypothetical protein
MGILFFFCLFRPDANIMERETGIEPASLAWKARVLPLNYSRTPCNPNTANHMAPPPVLRIHSQPLPLVEEAGFEPA